MPLSEYNYYAYSPNIKSVQLLPPCVVLRRPGGVMSGVEYPNQLSSPPVVRSEESLNLPLDCWPGRKRPPNSRQQCLIIYHQISFYLHFPHSPPHTISVSELLLVSRSAGPTILVCGRGGSQWWPVLSLL